MRWGWVNYNISEHEADTAICKIMVLVHFTVVSVVVLMTANLD